MTSQKIALVNIKGNLRIRRLWAEKKAALLGCSLVKPYNPNWSWKLKIEKKQGQRGLHNLETLEFGVYSKKIINGMENTITSWNFQFLVGETQPWTGHLGLHSSFVHFVKLSNIEAVYFGLLGEIFQELQEDKFWNRRIWNLNGIFWVPVYLWCDFFLDFLSVVAQYHRKFGLLEN